MKPVMDRAPKARAEGDIAAGYRGVARWLYPLLTVQFTRLAAVAPAPGGGAWVQAWLWVPERLPEVKK